MGGWSSDFASNIPATSTTPANVTIIADTLATASGATHRAVEVPATSTGVTIKGFTIIGGIGSGMISTAVYSEGGVTLTENILQAGDGSGGAGTVYALYAFAGDATVQSSRMHGPVNGTGLKSATVHFAGSATGLLEGNTITGGTTNHDQVTLSLDGSSPTVQNNTITGGTTAAKPIGVHLLGTSATIQNNNISGGTSTLTSSAMVNGILSDGASAEILNNAIFGGTHAPGFTPGTGNTVIGIYIFNDSTGMLITGNSIDGGVLPVANTDYSHGIFLAGSVVGGPDIINNKIVTATGASETNAIVVGTSGWARKIYNNTIFSGTGNIASIGILLSGPASGPIPSIQNNLITCGGSGTVVGISEALTNANPNLQNNAIGTSCPTMYQDAALGALANAAALNGTAAGSTVTGNVSLNPVFVDAANGDYRLTGTSPAEILRGGLDLSADFTALGLTAIDLQGTGRTAVLGTPTPTNTGAAGWSMGAYELD